MALNHRFQSANVAFREERQDGRAAQAVVRVRDSGEEGVRRVEVCYRPRVFIALFADAPAVSVVEGGVVDVYAVRRDTDYGAVLCV